MPIAQQLEKKSEFVKWRRAADTARLLLLDRVLPSGTRSPRPFNGTGGGGHRVAGREHGFDVEITRGETRVELPPGGSIAAYEGIAKTSSSPTTSP